MNSIDKVKFRLVLAFTRLLARLPINLGRKFGAFIGVVVFYALKKRRKIAIANIVKTMELKELSSSCDPYELAKNSFKNMGISGWETIKLLHSHIADFQNIIEFRGLDYFNDTLEKMKLEKKGLIILTGHMGNWELLCQSVSYICNIKMSIVGRTQGSPIIDALMTRLRTGSGNNFIFKSGGAREMLNVLKQGGILGTLIDQASIVNQEGIAINFLGRPALTSLAPIRLARKANAFVIYVGCYRENGKIIAEFTPRLNLSSNSDIVKAIEEDTQRCTDQLAAFIKKYPDQWLWGHRRWKTLEGISKNPDSII